MTGGAYASYDGTSLAAPVVTGVAALVLSKNPFLDGQQVKSILTRFSIDLGRKGWDWLYGYGRVDAQRALNSTSAPLSNLSVSQEFNMMKSSHAAIFFTATKNPILNVYVQDSKGKMIRKLIINKIWAEEK